VLEQLHQFPHLSAKAVLMKWPFSSLHTTLDAQLKKKEKKTTKNKQKKTIKIIIK